MLTFNINKQVLTMEGDLVVADTIKYLTATFTFSSDWNGYTKVLHIKKGGEVYDFPITDNTITEADNFSLTEGKWEIYLHGTKNGARVTTTSVMLVVRPFGNANGQMYPNVPQSVLDRLLLVIKWDGNGDKFLADDGTYKAIDSAVAEYLEEHPISVPTKTSELTNDSGYITLSAVPTSQINQNTTDINRIYKLSQGQIWDFEEKSESGTQVAPSGAKYESVMSVDGKTEQATYQGVNLFSGEFLQGQIDGSTGQYISYGRATMICSKDFIEISAPFSYYIPIASKVNKGRAYDSEKNYISTFPPSFTSIGEFTRYSLPTNTKYIKFELDFNDEADGVKYINKEVTFYLNEGTSVIYEPYVGGIPSPSLSYPQSIAGVTELNFNVNGTTHKIIPPKTMLVCGAKKDYLDVENGKWHWNIKTITSDDYAYNCHTDEAHFVVAETTANVNATDLAYLKTLQGIDVTNISITDQNGNDVSYLVEYIVKLNERTSTTNE